jgi:hypothetical protein
MAIFFKRLRIVLLLSLFPVLLAGFTDPQDDDGGVRRRLQIIYNGSFESVEVFIRPADGFYRSYGSIRHGGMRLIRLEGGRQYIVSLRRDGVRSVKRIYLPRHSDRELVFFAPNLAGVTLQLRGPFATARLYIDGQAQGILRRGEPRQIALPAGRRYLIRVANGDAERVRRIALALRGPGMHRRLVFQLRRGE